MNDLGQVVGGYAEGGEIHGFIDTAGSFVPLDVPGAPTTWAEGINDDGEVVGMFYDSDDNGTAQGFIATLVPEPESVALLATGLLAFAGMRRAAQLQRDRPR